MTIITSAPPEFIITDEDGILIGSSGGTALLPTSGASDGDVLAVQADGSLAFEAPVVTESLTDLNEWDTDTLVIPGNLTVRQSGGVAGTDEIQIYHDGSNAYISNQKDAGWLNLTPIGRYGAQVRTQITSKTSAFGGSILELVKGGAASTSHLRIQHAQGSLYAVAQGYASGDYDQGYAAYIHHSTFGSAALNIASDTTINFLAGGVGDEFIIGEFDSQGLVVRQPGGVAGTDELQIYHDGSNAYIDSQSGLVRINSTSNTELQINGSTNWTFKYNSLQASNSTTRNYSILRVGGVGDLNLGADQGDLILQPDGTAQGDIYLKQNTHLEGTLKVLQPGGVAGTDEIQIYHDGTDGYIVNQSGNLQINSSIVVASDGKVAISKTGYTPDIGDGAFKISGNDYLGTFLEIEDNDGNVGSTRLIAKGDASGFKLDNNNYSYVAKLHDYAGRSCVQLESNNAATMADSWFKVQAKLSGPPSSFTEGLKYTWEDGLEVAGVIYARQYGGVAGTDELQIYHDGSNAYIDSQSGNLLVTSDIKIVGSAARSLYLGDDDYVRLSSEDSGYALSFYNRYSTQPQVTIGGNSFQLRNAKILNWGTYSPHITWSTWTRSSATSRLLNAVNPTYDLILASTYGGAYPVASNRHHGKGIHLICGFGATPTDVNADGGNAGDLDVYLDVGGAGNGTGAAGADGKFRIIDASNSSVVLEAGIDGSGLIVRQNGGVAGTDEIQISHDGSNGLIASQSGDLWLDGGTTSVRVYNGRGTNQPMEILHNDQITYKCEYNGFWGYYPNRDYSFGKKNGGGNCIIRSDQGDLILQPDGTAQGDIYLKQDTHLIKTASNAVATFIIESELGNCLLKLDSYHASNDFSAIAFHGSNSSQPNQAIYVRGDTGDFSIRENNYTETWLSKTYGSAEVVLSSDLTVRQPGGVAGTDEIQIYHDGSNGYIPPQGGHLILQTPGNETLEKFIISHGDGGINKLVGLSLCPRGGTTGASLRSVGVTGSRSYLDIYTMVSNVEQIRARFTDNQGILFYTLLSVTGDIVTESTLIARQDGGVAGTDEIQIYHDGSNGHIDCPTGRIISDAYLDLPAGGTSTPSLTFGDYSSGPTGFYGSSNTIGVLAQSGLAMRWTANYVYADKPLLSHIGYQVDIGNDGGNRFGDLYIQKADLDGSLTVRQPGGVAGTDEIQIYHDGSNGHITSGVGSIYLNSPVQAGSITATGNITAGNKIVTDALAVGIDSPNKTVHLRVSTPGTVSEVLRIQNNTTTSSGVEIGMYSSGGTTALATIGSVRTNASGAGDHDFVFSVYNSGLATTVERCRIASDGEFSVAGSLVARQYGGVAGTDEVQIYHDGTDGYIDSQSGKLVLSAATDVDTTGSGFRMGEGSYLMETSTWGGAGFIFRYSGSQRFGVGASMRINNTASLSWTSDTALNTPNVAIGYRESKVLGVSGAWGIAELSADPSDPSEGESVIWQSDGTGSGDDGDIMMKITAGGVTKTTTLVDFSAV